MVFVCVLIPFILSTSLHLSVQVGDQSGSRRRKVTQELVFLYAPPAVLALYFYRDKCLRSIVLVDFRAEFDFLTCR